MDKHDVIAKALACITYPIAVPVFFVLGLCEGTVGGPRWLDWIVAGSLADAGHRAALAESTPARARYRSPVGTLYAVVSFRGRALVVVAVSS